MALSREDVALVAYNLKSAINELSKLIIDEKLAKKLSTNALKKMSINGTEKLSKKIYLLLDR
jgi:hypothetical protein